MHGKDFKGEKIPFGALVFFKPSGARAVDQDDKFDPKAIPGVFAGYNLGPGNHWNRQYRCWELADFTKQNLSYDTSRPAKAVARPHITEKVVLHQPLTFPLKQMYEYMNTTLEGLREHMRLDGEPIYIDDIDDDDDEDGDGGDDDQPQGGDEKQIESEGNPKMKELLQEINGPSFDASRAAIDQQDLDDYEQSVLGADDAADKKDELDAAEDKPGPSGEEPLKHYREGKPGDGIVYEDDWGYKCKIDKVGRPYTRSEKMEGELFVHRYDPRTLPQKIGRNFHWWKGNAWNVWNKTWKTKELLKRR